MTKRLRYVTHEPRHDAKTARSSVEISPTFPVVPGRVEFAAEVTCAAILLRPEAQAIVAVELAGLRLEDAFLQALARLPENVGDPLFRMMTTDDEARAIYVPVEPCDPFTEAVRSANDVDAEVVFIEPDAAQDRPHLQRHPIRIRMRSAIIGHG